MPCRICSNNIDNESFAVREMMFGTREVFVYFRCARCGCLQIAEMPTDLSAHYPPGYCSFKPSLERRFAGRLRNLFRLPRYRYAVLGGGWWGRALYALSPKPKLRKLARLDLTTSSRVLDVGCGTGSLLYKLREIGFEHLLGVDAFIDGDIEYGNGLSILKTTIDAVEGAWDCVMFNYSLEHMSDQHATLASAARLLAENGKCFVQIPLVSSYAWEHYGVNWAQLDAPRHLYLHSRDSFGRLAAGCGFRIEDVTYDSTDFQFTASECYARDIPLESERARRMFSRREIRAFRRQAAALNREERGDQAAFILRKE